MTANDPFNMTPSSSNLPGIIATDIAPLAGARDLDTCRVAIERVQDAMLHVESDALAVALELGLHAGTAREIIRDMPGQTFQDWVAKHFGAESRRPLTIHWVRACINAAEAMHAIERLPASDRKEVLSKITSIEKLSRAFVASQEGKSYLAIASASAAPVMGRPKVLKIDRSPEAPAPAPAPVHDVQSVDLSALAAKLDQKAAVLEAKEARLQAWEDDLTRREALLDGKVTDAVVKEPNGLDAARAMARKKPKTTEDLIAKALKKGAAKPNGAAAKPRKSKVDTKVAPTPENGSDAAVAAAPETVAPIEVKSDADKAMDQPHHGHAPDVIPPAPAADLDGVEVY